MTKLDKRQKQSAALLILAQTATKTGDVLTNPKTVLTWLLSSLGTSGAIISFLVPIRESGSMLPQLFISDWVKKAPKRKWVFVGGSIAQALAIASMGLAALTLPPTAAGITILLALAAFATARAFCSISSKDVLGRSIPKGFRGRVGGLANTASGILAAAAAASLLLTGRDGSPSLLPWIVLGASLLWLLGATAYAFVREHPNDANDDSGENHGALKRLQLVRDDLKFRRFILSRSLLLGTALASPVLVSLSQQSNGSLSSLVAFIIATGIASSTSSFLWGRLADHSSSRAMASGGFLATLIGASACGLALWSPAWLSHPVTWPAVFLLFNIAYEGVRLGRKTWVVDAAEGDKRTDYVSASNTLIAVLILIIGALNSPLQAWNPLLSLALYSLLCLIGALIAIRMGD